MQKLNRQKILKDTELPLIPLSLVEEFNKLTGFEYKDPPITTVNKIREWLGSENDSGSITV